MLFEELTLLSLSLFLALPLLVYLSLSNKNKDKYTFFLKSILAVVAMNVWQIALNTTWPLSEVRDIETAIWDQFLKRNHYLSLGSRKILSNIFPVL